MEKFSSKVHIRRSSDLRAIHEYIKTALGDSLYRLLEFDNRLILCYVKRKPRDSSFVQMFAALERQERSNGVYASARVFCDKGLPNSTLAAPVELISSMGGERYSGEELAL